MMPPSFWINPMSENLNKPTDSIWNTFTCVESNCYLWQTGPLKVWIKRIGRDWLIASENRPEETPASTPWSLTEKEPSNLSWQRWTFNRIHEKVEVKPCMPDRPLVVKTHAPTNLPPGVDATFYVSIPLWVSFRITSSEMSEINRYCGVTLSNTWFGNHEEGEFCYALKTRAVRNLADARNLPHRALCPVVIHNKAEMPLPIQKICIRAKHLNIYQSEKQIWTNRINVSFRGDGLSSKVEYDDEPPMEAKYPILLNTAEEQAESGVLHTLGQTFGDLF